MEFLKKSYSQYFPRQQSPNLGARHHWTHRPESFQRVRKGFQKVPTEHGGTLGTHIKTVFRPNLLTKPFFLLSSQKVDWIAADPTL